MTELLNEEANTPNVRDSRMGSLTHAIHTPNHFVLLSQKITFGKSSRSYHLHKAFYNFACDVGANSSEDGVVAPTLKKNT